MNRLAQGSRVAHSVDDAADVETLPVPWVPAVATEVLTRLQSGDADTGTLHRLLRREPAIAAGVLRIANAPGYQPRVPLLSVADVEVRLGPRVLDEIALAASIQQGVFSAPGQDNELRWILRRALACAAFAKLMVTPRTTTARWAFTCGLLSNLGEPVVLCARAVTAKGDDTDTPEVLHALVGRRVAKLWKLPPLVVACIEREIPAGWSPEMRELIALVGRCRELAADLCGPGRSPRARPPRLGSHRAQVQTIVDSLTLA
jgi:HD-like signal output (HDOD) protein